MESPVKAVRRAAELRRALQEMLPWTRTPLVVGAPMRVFSSPALAVAISRAGGLGFIGSGATPESANTDLAEAVRLLQVGPSLRGSPGQLLPVGVGFVLWSGDLDVASKAVEKYRPCAVWLYAPCGGKAELEQWAQRLRVASPGTQVWVQVGTLLEAVEFREVCDVLVVQGAEAGGHGRARDAIGILTLLPEMADRLAQEDGRAVPLVAAGGIADGRGVVAALGVGAAGAAMGTRFLAAAEARIAPAYQAEVVRASDGAVNTGRTLLYNHLRGTFGWPKKYSPRGLLNQSFRDSEAGVPMAELQRRHDAAVRAGGSAAWGPEGRVATYAGASVGLVRSVQPAAEIVDEVCREASEITGILDSKL